MKYSPNVLELFAGAGGMSLGLEMAGFKSLLLNEIDADACRTLKTNRPNWIVCQRDIREISFEEYEWEVDLLAGGFPCQSFSYAGKGMGFDDVRGTLFYEFARAIKECKPRMFVAENVRGIIKHDGGNTFQTVLRTFDELGYTMLNTGVLNASDYGVPQNRERVFLVGVSNEYKHRVSWSPPKAHETQMTLWDALHAGVMYRKDVPDSVGDSYSEAKKKVMDLVPAGGCWRDLPVDIQRSYMKSSYYSSGGRTGIAKRLSWYRPSPTLTTSPSQKQTERCHPDETRPLTTREYARIQSFPDEWKFTGSKSSIYRQIGNAVPVRLAEAVGSSIFKVLKDIENLEGCLA